MFYDQLLERVRALPGCHARRHHQPAADGRLDASVHHRRPARSRARQGAAGRLQRGRRAGARHARDPAAARPDDRGARHAPRRRGSRWSTRRSPTGISPGRIRWGRRSASRSGPPATAPCSEPQPRTDRRRRRRRDVSELLHREAGGGLRAVPAAPGAVRTARTSGSTRARSLAIRAVGRSAHAGPQRPGRARACRSATRRRTTS